MKKVNMGAFEFYSRYFFSGIILFGVIAICFGELLLGDMSYIQGAIFSIVVGVCGGFLVLFVGWMVDLLIKMIIKTGD